MDKAIKRLLSKAPPSPPQPAEVTKVENTDAVDVDQIIDNCRTQWSTDGSGMVFWGSGVVAPTLPPALYRIWQSDKTGTTFIKQRIESDKLIEMKGSESLEIITEIERFWDLKQKFIERGLLHKRGILLSGDPGSGKTSTIQLLIKRIVDRGGLALYPANSPIVTAIGLKMIRDIEPEKPICLILEDFETLVQHNEGEWLSILDGESQVNNVVFLATTNYISRLDKRFVDRPSRFDSIVTVPMPNDSIRRQYLKLQEPDMSPEEVARWLVKTEGMSIAHLKEVIISVKVFGYSLESTIDRMKEMHERLYDEKDNLAGTRYAKQKPGFN